jgi:hypothetical protein
VRSRDGRSIHLTLHQQHIAIRLARSKEHIRRNDAATKPNEWNDTKLSLSILESLGSKKERIGWRDDENGKLESRITEIAVELVLTAEIRHRESASLQSA